jgi:CHAD domain-containing protein
MADGKWITDLTARAPLVDAARRVLTLRLQVVHDHLPLALQHWKEDPEHVHQLRVGTRRAGAALGIFESCLPGKVHRKIRKHLRHIRQAAGAARDWDVFEEALSVREQQASTAQRPGLDFLIGYSQGQRVAAQQALAAASPQAPFDFEAIVGHTLTSLRDPSLDPLAHRLSDVARPHLVCLLRDLQTAAEGNLEEYEHLHQVRILGKRLRYAMEVFASCFETSFKDSYYPLIEEMQEILGRANDSHIASQRLACLRGMLKSAHPDQWKRFKAGLEGLLRYHQRRLPEQRRMFEKWWQRWQKTGAGAGLTGMVSVAI